MVGMMSTVVGTIITYVGMVLTSVRMTITIVGMMLTLVENIMEEVIMKKIFLGIAVALLFAGICWGWERTYGGSSDDYGSYIAQTSDGGYIIAGYTEWFDVYVLRINTYGDTIWTRKYGGCEWDMAFSVSLTSDGGFMVAGGTESFGEGSSDVWVLRLNSDGDTIWTRTYGGSDFENGYSISHASDEGYIIVGTTNSFTGSFDVYALRIDVDGDTIWSRTYGGDNAKSVSLTPDGGYIVAGGTGYLGGDIYILKLDDDGDTIWTRTYGGDYYDGSRSVSLTTDGGYIVAGWTVLYYEGPANIWVLKIDAYGDTIWTKTCGSGYSRSVSSTSDGGYIVAGVTNVTSTHDAHDAFLLKLDCDGNIVWRRTYGGSDSDVALSVSITSDHGFIISGTTQSFGAGARDVYVIKTDSLGYSCAEWYEIFTGWNLISIPFNDTFAIADLFPFYILPAWVWDNETKEFNEIDTVTSGIAFWLASPLDTVLAINGTREATSITDTLYRGWNMLGAPSIAVDDSVITALPEVMGDIFFLDGEAQAYDIADCIRPGYGYWVFTSDTVEIEIP